jgi:hypothetical protein
MSGNPSMAIYFEGSILIVERMNNLAYFGPILY